MIILMVGGRHWSHLSFTDDEERVSSGSLSNDVLSVFIVRLSGEKTTEMSNSIIFTTLRHQIQTTSSPEATQQMFKL